MFPPADGSSGGLPSPVEYLSPKGVLLPGVDNTIASPLWLELRGPRCLAGGPLLGCVPACLSSIVAMAQVDACHGP